MKHPIFNLLINGFDSFVALLNEQVVIGNVDTQTWNGLTLFDYSRQCQFDEAWNDVTMITRGLVLDLTNKKIVGLTFPKFFNLGQRNANFKDLPYSIYEKMDGSLGIAFYTESGWKINTRGSFASEQAVKAQTMLKMDGLDPQCTYLFEIIYPTNKIVINYHGREELVLLGIYNNETLEELEPEQVDEIALKLGYTRPKRFNFNSFEEMHDLVKKMPKDEEGVVVRFSDGSRLKIKGDEYCHFHAILSHFSPLKVWEAVRDMKQEAYLKDLPDECQDDFKNWSDSYLQSFLSYKKELLNEFEKYKSLSDKELGILKQANKLPSICRFIFPLRKRGLDQFEDPKPMGLRYSLFDLFRPKGNEISKWAKKLEE